jgi:hypothetical protein
LQPSIDELRRDLKDVRKDLAALKGPCGSCQNPTPNRNPCGGYCASCPQSCACAPQPPPCGCPPVSCSGGCAACQASAPVVYPVPDPAITSYSDQGWRPVRDDGGVQPSSGYSLVRATPIPTTTPVVPSDHGRWYALRPATPSGVASYAIPERSVALTSASGTGINLTPVAEGFPSQRSVVSQPVWQPARADLVPVVRSEAAANLLPEIDDDGWRPARD